MEKPNIAEILKDCPKGMKLDCTMFEGLEFDGIIDNSPLPIRCRILNPDGYGYNIYNFTKYGCWNTSESAKCVIFPKGKTTWEGFVPPCQFKAGDVAVTTLGNIVLLAKLLDDGVCYSSYCLLFHTNTLKLSCTYVKPARFATEEEKHKLFDAIKANGYKWNAETKTLDKLIEPKFKVGDKVRYKGENTVITITGIKDNYYFIQFYNPRKNDYQTERFSFKDQDDWVLVPNKFDITTLKPFDKVLIRSENSDIWECDIFSSYNPNCSNPYHCIGAWFEQCIPYEGNEHLRGTTKDCDEYFKTWE